MIVYLCLICGRRCSWEHFVEHQRIADFYRALWALVLKGAS